jgi:hypothetical protein
MNEMRETEEKKLYLYPLVIVMLLFGVISTFDDHNTDLFVREGGVVESLTAILYFSCFAYLVREGKLPFVKKYYYLASVPLLFGLRELDFHSRFTTESVLRGSFYIRGHVPFYEKIIGGIMVLVGLANVFLIIRNHGATFLLELKKGSPRPVGVLLVIVFIVTSLTLDGIARKVASIGIKLDPAIVRYCEILEETSELGIAITLMIMFLCYFRHEAQKLGNAGTETNS